MQALKRPMPVGIEDFKDLITGNYYFIDKTRFIRELVDTQGKVPLITRPRRFGKTLTLSMLQYFFTLENAEENRKLFTGLDKSPSSCWMNTMPLSIPLGKTATTANA